MPVQLAQLLLSLNLLAAMVWVGGMVGITVTTIAARQTLGPDQQVRFFRALGRRWGVVSAVALTIFAGTGLALAGGPGGWTDIETAAVALTLIVAALTVAGVVNARAVQRLRAEALEQGTTPDEGNGPLRSARRTANALRGLVAHVTLAAVLVATI